MNLKPQNIGAARFCRGLTSNPLNPEPQVMEEVQLGPLLGTGAYGSCYRGSWRGTQVAVKVLGITSLGTDYDPG